MIYTSKQRLLYLKNERFYGQQKDIRIYSSNETSHMSYRYSFCGNLTSLVFPASLTSISDNAFNWCSNVDTLSFLGRMDSINWNAFTDGNSANQNIKRVYINDLSTWLNSQRYIDIKIVGYEALSAPEAVLYLDGKLLTDMVVPEGVKEIKPYTFYGMDSIRSVTLPKTLKNIAKSAFENCVSLTSVAFPEGLTGIEDAAFYGCSGLVSIVLPKSLTSIGESAFSGCSGLDSISLPEGLTSVESHSFNCCTNLKSVSFPEGLTSIGFGAFESYCTANEKIPPFNLLVHPSKKVEKRDTFSSLVYYSSLSCLASKSLISFSCTSAGTSS